jgi:NAD(P)-dependent dehydrogenase (short-subunit alcohol dehydrogenase family)
MNIKELQTKYDLTGKTVVITGGSGILGSEIACALVGVGASVAVIDRNTKLPEDIMHRIETSAGKFMILSGDVLVRDSLEQAAVSIRKEFGNIYALINAAGGNQAGATTGPDRSFFELDTEAIRNVFDLNLLGTVLACQVFGRYMADAGEGIILTISSMSAFRPLTRVPGYSAAKAAVSNFTQWLAVHFAEEYSTKIRVNALAPGFFLTEQNRFLLTNQDDGSLTRRGESIIAHTPVRRFGNPEDLLGAVLWLISPLSDFVTGSVVPVDGGFAAFGGV